MPTGYTAAIKDGIDFKTFAMNCARAFGACVELRDEGGGGEIIPESFAPSDYHRKRIEELNKKLSDLWSMSEELLHEKARESYEAEELQWRRNIQDSRDLRAKYEAMLKQISDWTPPTEDHYKLYEFMMKQVVESIKFDCHEEYYNNNEIVLLSGEEWFVRERDRLAKDIAYHAEEQVKEIKRANEKTAWIKALRASL